MYRIKTSNRIDSMVQVQGQDVRCLIGFSTPSSGVSYQLPLGSQDYRKEKELKRESVITYVKDLAEFTHVFLIIREMTFQLS